MQEHPTENENTAVVTIVRDGDVVRIIAIVDNVEYMTSPGGITVEAARNYLRLLVPELVGGAR